MRSHIQSAKSLLIHGGVFFILHSTAAANGGGYVTGGVGQTGSILGFEPRDTERVRMLEERLTIRLGPDQAAVDVRYLMRNETNRRVTVRFGFPVEEIRGGPEHELFHAPANAKPLVEPFGHLKNYQAMLGGRRLDARWQAEPRNAEQAPQFRSIAGWMVSNAAFRGNEELPLQVRFAAPYSTSRWSVSESGWNDARIFRYRLSSAACWAGSIQRGEIVIEPEGIHPDDVRIIKPVNRFEKDGDRWVWRFEELEPTFDDDLVIETQPRTGVHGWQALGGRDAEKPEHQFFDYLERQSRWSMLHTLYEVRASSTLPPEGDFSYDAENVRNRWKVNAWSEGAPGPGTGEWLEITPAVAKPLIEILIAPGYQKGELFEANARPKTIRVVLNDEHTFDVAIPDRAAEFSLPVRGYHKPVRKIRLTFTEVFPGTRFEDLCITRVLLHARLDREPAIEPVR